MARAAVNLRRGGIAVIDSDGEVRWIDEAWASGDGEVYLPRVSVGLNLLRTYLEFPDPRTQAIANAISAVLAGKATYFEIENRETPDTEDSFVTSVAALRGPGAGAVLIHRAAGAREPAPHGRSARPRSSDQAQQSDGLDRLTPREREVLDLMAVGQDNRAIAARLGIRYTTVRGHVRSVIEKLGARSRLAAVARAYQKDLVPK
jgi:DNA-binding NarL/FixJ family response regulator